MITSVESIHQDSSRLQPTISSGEGQVSSEIPSAQSLMNGFIDAFPGFRQKIVETSPEVVVEIQVDNSPDQTRERIEVEDDAILAKWRWGIAYHSLFDIRGENGSQVFAVARRGINHPAELLSPEEREISKIPEWEEIILIQIDTQKSAAYFLDEDEKKEDAEKGKPIFWQDALVEGVDSETVIKEPANIVVEYLSILRNSGEVSKPELIKERKNEYAFQMLEDMQNEAFYLSPSSLWLLEHEQSAEINPL